MRVTDVKAYVLSATPSTQWRFATGTYAAINTVLVRVQTDEGITGWGECLTRFAPEANIPIVEKALKPVVVGQDPFAVEYLWQRMYAVVGNRGHSKGYMVEAISGVDIALWDIIGKALGQPLHRVLGSYNRERVPVYASSIYFEPTAERVKQAEALAEQGFTSIKMKVGEGVEADMRNVRAIRRALGDGIVLTVDATCAFDTLTAMRLGRQLEAEGIGWFEEPVSPENIDGYSKLAQALDMPIAGGEAEFTRWAFKELFVRQAIDIIQPNVGRVGGITEARKIAALASAFDIPVSPHLGASAAVTAAATLQWAASLPNLLSCEVMFSPNPLREELLVEPLPRMRDGFVEVPSKPGLGIEVDERALERFKQN